jgi:hypothetical protein
MRRLFIAALFLTCLATGQAFAEESVPLPPASLASSESATDLSDEKQDPAIEHLLKAAEHLEAAGLHDDAVKLRHDARQRASHDNLLSRKESELECLQEEVDRLRELLGQTTAIQIDITAVEVDRRKLGLKAAEFDKLVGLFRTSPGRQVRTAEAAGIVEANPARLPLFRELCERGILKVLTEPTLTTTSGRPANFSDGGEIAVRVKLPNGEFSIRNVRFGTDLEVVAEMRPNQRIRLQTAFELRELRNNVIDDEGSSHPEVHSRRLNTQVELQPGQTLTLGRLAAPRSKSQTTGAATKETPAKAARGERNGPGQPAPEEDDSSDSIETIVFVTPRLIHSGIVPRATEDLPPPDELQEDDTLQPIVPAGFDPTNASQFGPAIPILKRRAVKD